MATTREVHTSRRSALLARAQGLADTAPGRFFRAHPDLSAALFFAGLIFVYLWPVLVGGKILSPVSVLYQWTPWAREARPDVYSYFNPLLSDIATADYPWRSFLRESLHSGTIPLWNPHVFGGIPFLSNPQIGLFTPFNLPLWMLPLNYGIGLSAAIKLWAGGFGTYLVARQMRLGFLPGLLAGTAFAFSALNITWLTHETLPAVAVLLPWMVWLIERLYERARLGTMLWLAVATAWGLGGGHPGMQVHLIALAGLYAIVRVWLVPDLDRREQLRRLGLVCGGLALGIALMAVMLIPEALSSHGTIGTQARANGRGTLPGTVMPLDALKTTLFPDWWGRPSSIELGAGPNSAGGVVNYNERTFYAGIVSALFALMALVSRGGWRRKAPFAVLAFVGLAVPAHLPVLWTFLTHVPPFDVVQNQRMHFAYAFGAAILAAFGLRELLDRPAQERWRLAVPGVAIGLGLIVLLSIEASGSDISHTFRHFTSGTSFPIRKVLELTSVSWFLFFSVGVAAAALAALRWPRARYGIAVAVVLLAAADGLHFANGYQPMGKASDVIPPTTPAIRYLQAHADRGRINGLGVSLTQDWSTTYGLSDIRGYDPPNPTRRLYSLWKMANAEQLDWTPFSMAGQDVPSVQVESVLGARYVITDPGLKLGDDVRLNPVLSALKVVYSGPDATIMENRRAAPRVELPASIAVANDQNDAETRIGEASFQPSDQVVIESSDPAALALARQPRATGHVAIAREENARMTLDATLDRTGLVVLNDSLTPGWTVTVDGRTADPVRVNSVMRGVVAGPGHHTIVWSYRMPGLRIGFLLSLLALLGIVGGAVVLTVCARRS
ncbi:MAG TPA: YfhO family protein [Baekduia sp.]